MHVLYVHTCIYNILHVYMHTIQSPRHQASYQKCPVTLCVMNTFRLTELSLRALQLAKWVEFHWRRQQNVFSSIYLSLSGVQCYVQCVQCVVSTWCSKEQCLVQQCLTTEGAKRAERRGGLRLRAGPVPKLLQIPAAHQQISL